MDSEYAFLQLTKHELVELHRAMLSRFVMDSLLRREHALEAPSEPPILERLEALLGIDPEEAHALFHQTEDELWEYAWYVYTDEWAWFRARQDVLKELGASAKKKAAPEIDQLVEKKYEDKFERYVREIDMKEVASRKASAKHPKKK